MRRAPIIVFSALALMLTAAGAAAEDEATPAPEQPRRRSAEILAQMDQPKAEGSWLRHHLDRIHFNGEAGLAYTQPLSLGNRDLEFTLSGPALGPEQLGLCLEIRF